MQKYWFKAKTYGWGWTPATMQGWLVMLGYVLAIVASSLWLVHRSSITEGWIEYAISIAGITSVLIIICYKTGEKPRWRWG